MEAKQQIMSFLESVNWKWHGWDWMLFVGAIAGITIGALTGIIRPVSDNFDAIRSTEKAKIVEQASDSTVKN